MTVEIGDLASILLEYEPDQLVGEGSQEYIHPDNRQTVTDQFQQISATGELSALVRYRHATRSGEWVWLEGRFTDLPDDTLEGYVISSRDISRQVAAERDRRITEPDSHFVDTDGRSGESCSGVFDRYRMTDSANS